MTIPSLAVLARDTGVTPPAMLERLFNDGKTRYGASREEWKATWKSRMLNDPPAMICVYDFEWLDEKEIQENLRWLSPQNQGGRQFFPFAQSGAGDVYALVPASGGGSGVAYISHDAGEGWMEALSFDDFVFIRVAETLGDFSHLADELTEDEARQCVIADVSSLLPYMPEHHAALLAPFRGRLLAHAEVACGRRKETVPCLITPDEVETLLSAIEKPDDSVWQVTPRWEC
jgi:hypothetical protein